MGVVLDDSKLFSMVLWRLYVGVCGSSGDSVFFFLWF